MTEMTCEDFELAMCDVSWDAARFRDSYGPFPRRAEVHLAQHEHCCIATHGYEAAS